MPGSKIKRDIKVEALFLPKADSVFFLPFREGRKIITNPGNPVNPV